MKNNIMEGQTSLIETSTDWEGKKKNNSHEEIFYQMKVCFYLDQL